MGAERGDLRILPFRSSVEEWCPRSSGLCYYFFAYHLTCWRDGVDSGKHLAWRLITSVLTLGILPRAGRAGSFDTPRLPAGWHSLCEI